MVIDNSSAQRGAPLVVTGQQVSAAAAQDEARLNLSLHGCLVQRGAPDVVLDAHTRALVTQELHNGVVGVASGNDEGRVAIAVALLVQVQVRLHVQQAFHAIHIAGLCQREH